MSSGLGMSSCPRYSTTISEVLVVKKGVTDYHSNQLFLHQHAETKIQAYTDISQSRVIMGNNPGTNGFIEAVIILINKLLRQLPCY